MICECCQQRITIKNLNNPNEDFIEVKILNAVSEYYGISKHLIEGKSRVRNVAEARFVFVEMLYNDPYSRITMAAIGRLLNRDHTTIIHSIKQVRNWLQIDDNFRNNYLNVHLKVYNQDAEFMRKVKTLKTFK
jgi:chromosomal replication initiation ATPase DnaA